MRSRHYRFVIAAYNVEPFIPRLVTSLRRQTYEDWSAVFVDDCSTDRTLETLEAKLVLCGLDEKFKIVRNRQRRRKAYNVYHALKFHGQDADVVAILDGDDRLADYRTLETLQKEYDHGWEVVWSKWRGTDGSRGNSDHLNPFLNPRLQPFVTSHLFTFNRELFDVIEPGDLQDDRGEWFTAGCDVAIAWPILEQTIKRKYVGKVLYEYNRDNHLNLDKIGTPYREYVSGEQARTVSTLRRRRGKTTVVDKRFALANLAYFLRAAVWNSRLVNKYYNSHMDTIRVRRGLIPDLPASRRIRRARSS